MRTENFTLGLLKVTDVLYKQFFEVVERKLYWSVFTRDWGDTNLRQPIDTALARSFVMYRSREMGQ